MIMSEKRGSCNTPEEVELRRGPWTLDEDTLLIHYIACHGEGRWNLLARCSGLKRTGKSCRLRWLNYLKPDIKRGNLSIEEQLLILDLHSKWGNRWSRIAQHLPGRTDNEIKNYWRTRVQKQARQLKIDANSSLFRDAVRCYWIPRLIERSRMQGSSPVVESLDSCSATIAAEATPCLFHAQEAIHPRDIVQQVQNPNCTSSGITTTASVPYVANFTHYEHEGFYYSPGSRDLQAKLSAAPATLSHSMTGSWNGASTIYDNSTGGSTSAHSMWSMDELYGMLQNYMESNP